jgi:hypothetical protein
MQACTVEEWAAHPFWRTHISSENCFLPPQAAHYKGDVFAQARACGTAQFFPISNLEVLSGTIVEMGHA